MCLFKIQKTYKIADKDIECYKLLNLNLQSCFYNYTYQLETLHKKTWNDEFIKYANSLHTLGGNMFHACLDKHICERFYGAKEEKIITKSPDGTTQTNYKRSITDKQVLVKCIIPKGSRYYLGTFSEVGCEQLYVKEICQL